MAQPRIWNLPAECPDDVLAAAPDCPPLLARILAARGIRPGTPQFTALLAPRVPGVEEVDAELGGVGAAAALLAAGLAEVSGTETTSSAIPGKTSPQPSTAPTGCRATVPSPLAMIATGAAGRSADP